ncbi:hypothetical protein MUG91_G21n45 [Manis pentadactyla]|nr:hypothetical protein MUG91_G21n45 [Manis pentadactyla]
MPKLLRTVHPVALAPVLRPAVDLSPKDDMTNSISHIGMFLQFESLNEKQSHSPSRAAVNPQPLSYISGGIAKRPQLMSTPLQRGRKAVPFDLGGRSPLAGGSVPHLPAENNGGHSTCQENSWGPRSKGWSESLHQEGAGIDTSYLEEQQHHLHSQYSSLACFSRRIETDAICFSESNSVNSE